MQNVKPCPDCGKTISAEDLAYCWSCWNQGRPTKHQEHYCKCGIDISENENPDICKHSANYIEIELKLDKVVEEPEPKVGRLSKTDYYYAEIRVSGLFQEATEGQWERFERQQMENFLKVKIDMALEKGSKQEFLEFTEKLNKFREEIANG